MAGAQFLRNLIAAVPYATRSAARQWRPIHRACHTNAFHHISDRVCDENGIERRITKVSHPWTTASLSLAPVHKRQFFRVFRGVLLAETVFFGRRDGARRLWSKGDLAAIGSWGIGRCSRRVPERGAVTGVRSA